MLRRPAPSPTAVFVGRDAELGRLAAGLASVPVALVYGVAGVGKSALAYAAAAAWSPHAVHRQAHGEPLGPLVDDVRRQLAGTAVPEIASDDERLADLAARLDAEPCLLVVDDLHALEKGAASRLVGALSRALRRGKLVATSRERLPRRPGDPDRLEIALDGLAVDGARALWQSLDALYGPAGGFEEAAQRAKGNPFQLRRAHAGGLDDDDPIAAAVAALGGDERSIAGALALSAWRLPMATLGELTSTERARAAVRRLVTLFVADVDGAATVGVHGLFRDAIQEALSADEARALHGALAHVLPGAGFDLVVRVRETARHLILANRAEDAGRYLASQALEMVKHGAAGELFRALEAVPEAARTDEAKLARARCLPRLLEFPRACDELGRLVAARAEPLAEVKVAFGTVALSAGRVEEGVAALREVLDDDAAPAGTRTSALMQTAWGLAHAGRGDEARRMLVEAEAKTSDEVERALYAFVRATTLWHEEREPEAEDAIRRAKALLPDKAPPYTASVMVPLALAAMLARLGRRDEAEELRTAAESASVGYEDLQSQVYVKRMRAAVVYEWGERLEALALLEWVSDAYEKGGGVVGQLLADSAIARILLDLGRREAGLALLEKTRKRAKALGHGLVVESVERSRAHDPVALVEAGKPPPPASPVKRGAACRQRALAAIFAAGRGEGEETRALVARNAGSALGQGYALDRALGHLAMATLARVEGQPRATSAELARAQACAEEDGIDAELLLAIQERLGALRLVTAKARRAADAPAKEIDRYQVVLDGRSHELRAKKRVIPLARRPALRKLLYTLASRPNAVVSKEALAGCLWSARYNPLTHDNALWVNLRRLRVLLAKTGLAVELDDEGYGLTVPASFLYVDPAP